MTKILYIPTGTYLKWYCENYEDKDTRGLTETLEKRGNRTHTIEETIERLLNTEVLLDKTAWLNMNNIILPVLLSELEIIYD